MPHNVGSVVLAKLKELPIVDADDALPSTDGISTKAIGLLSDARMILVKS